ncbi:MAG: hypothetical protein P8100_09060 [bacterium]
MRLIEDQLEKRLRKILDKDILLSKGPFVVKKYTGIQPEVNIHAGKLIDFEGRMDDGARVARKPVQGHSTFKGFEEDRPGRIKIAITCTSGNYKLLQNICSKLSVSVLSELQLLPKIPLGASGKDTEKLEFVDFTKTLHRIKFTHEQGADHAFFKGKLIFHLNGFIHVYLTRRGGFRSRAVTGDRIKTRKITTPAMKRSLNPRKKS